MEANAPCIPTTLQLDNLYFTGVTSPCSLHKQERFVIFPKSYRNMPGRLHKIEIALETLILTACFPTCISRFPKLRLVFLWINANTENVFVNVFRRPYNWEIDNFWGYKNQRDWLNNFSGYIFLFLFLGGLMGYQTIKITWCGVLLDKIFVVVCRPLIPTE